jgi:phosphate:Na+ symporter
MRPAPPVIGTLLGGIGLFLLGMILMTGGLKSLAGESLRKILGRFTGGPFAAMATGAAMTAVVQSSSATTLTIIGFVSAGLLTFTQSVGLIFGANIGTTSTSWLVSLLGLKLDVSAVALPVVGVGALMQLLGRGRTAHAGLALAGFGLIFVGIDTLQAGMGGVSEHIDPSSFPRDSFGGRLALVGIGAVMTVVMQSSSAAAATTLTALDAETIHLTQAACLVVGQNIGTTVKAALASIGASVPAKRTAVAHILFNLGTGVVAFAVLPLFVGAVDALTEAFGQQDEAVSLAAFHTAFNALGVALFLPFVGRYAAWIERMVPERRPALVRHLDRSVARVGPVAIEAARRAVRDIGVALMGVAHHRLRSPHAAPGRSLDEAEVALAEVRRFLSLVSTTDDATTYARHVSILHALDHLERFATACREPAATRASEDAELGPAAALLRQALEAGQAWFASEEGEGEELPTAPLEDLARGITAVRRDSRPELLRRAAAGRVGPELLGQRLLALRWADRLAYHLARAAHHLREEPAAQGEHDAGPPSSALEEPG